MMVTGSLHFITMPSRAPGLTLELRRTPEQSLQILGLNPGEPWLKLNLDFIADLENFF